MSFQGPRNCREKGHFIKYFALKNNFRRNFFLANFFLHLEIFEGGPDAADPPWIRPRVNQTSVVRFGVDILIWCVPTITALSCVQLLSDAVGNYHVLSIRLYYKLNSVISKAQFLKNRKQGYKTVFLKTRNFTLVKRSRNRIFYQTAENS